jgi:hypothetical protein
MLRRQMMFSRIAGFALLLLGGRRTLVAQASVLSGTIARDSAGTAVAGAEVLLPALKRSATTNDAGAFRLEKLPAGRYEVMVRHVGFEPLIDTVQFDQGSHVDRRFLLTEKPAHLEPTVTTAPERKYIAPALREFEERRRQGFGHFITDEELRKDESRDMANIIIGHLPGLARFRVPNDGQGGHGQTYIGTARKCGDGPAFLSCRSGGSYCPVTLYVDGVVVFNSANNKSTADIPDLTLFRAADYAGIEYYAGGASMPTKFNFTSSGCGVLLLWSRER